MTPDLTNSFPATAVTIPSRLFWIVVITVLYALGGGLGLSAATVDSHITLVWPPTGIAIAALLRCGLGVWPGIALGAFIVNLWLGSPLPVALAIMVGNTLGPLCGDTWSIADLAAADKVILTAAGFAPLEIVVP